MAVVSKNILKDWFKRGKKPLESQFSDLIDSYHHKGDKIPVSQITGIEEIVNSKADASEFDRIRVALSELQGEKVSVSHDLDWSQPMGNAGKYTKILDLPSNCEVILNVTRITKGYSSMNTIWLSNYYTSSLTTMYDWDFRTRNGGGRAISLMIPSITIDMGVSVSFSIQVLHYNGKTPIRLYSDLSESSSKNASVSANVLWRDTPSVSDEVTVIDINAYPCEIFDDNLLVSMIDLDMSQGREFLIKDFENGNIKGYRAGLVVIVPSNVEEDCIYRFTATMDIPIITFTTSAEDEALLTAKEKLKKGDTLVVTTYSGGWIYSIMQAPITSKDGSVDISYDVKVPNLSVPVSAFPVDCDDAATANMGSPWRMPTKLELDELIEETTQEKIFDDDSHFIGIRFTSKKNGASIVLPNCGFKFGDQIVYKGVIIGCATKSVFYGCFDEEDFDEEDFDEEDPYTKKFSEISDLCKDEIIVFGLNVRGVANSIYGTGVDLGLSVNWATCNVGAYKELEVGDYFSWGESVPKYSFGIENHKYATGIGCYNNVLMSKYNDEDNLTVLDNTCIPRENGEIHLKRLKDKNGDYSGEVELSEFRTKTGIYKFPKLEIRSSSLKVMKIGTETYLKGYEIGILTPSSLRDMTCTSFQYDSPLHYYPMYGQQGSRFRTWMLDEYDTKRQSYLLVNRLVTYYQPEDGDLAYVETELDLTFVPYYVGEPHQYTYMFGTSFKVRAGSLATLIHYNGKWYPYSGCESPQYNTCCRIFDKRSFDAQTKDLGGGKYKLLVPDGSSWVVEISYCPKDATFVGIGIETVERLPSFGDPGILDMSTCTIINKGTGGFSFSAPYGELNGNVEHPIYGNVSHEVKSDSITRLMHYDGVWYLNDY